MSSYTPVAGGPTGSACRHARRGRHGGLLPRAHRVGQRSSRRWQRFYGRPARSPSALRRRSPSRCRPSGRPGAGGATGAWEQLFERPLADARRRPSADDPVRGVVADRRADRHVRRRADDRLRQNRCFLYHVIGNGTGDWDVPVGGMGAVTGALADARPAAGARARHRRRGAGGRPRRRGAFRRGDERARRRGGHVLANVAPGDPRPAARRRARGRARRARSSRSTWCCAGCPGCATGVDPARASPAPSTSTSPTPSWRPAYAQAAAGALPEPPPCEIYCHSLTDPSILGPADARRARTR